MAVPDFQTLMLPILKTLSSGDEIKVPDLYKQVADAEGLTHDDLGEMLPSGRQTKFVNRVSWAVQHMRFAELLERTKRGVYRITPEGNSLLSQTPSRIDISTLRKYPAYEQWIKRTRTPSLDKKVDSEPIDDPKETPDDTLDRITKELCNTLEGEVLDNIRKAEPNLLERVVVKLLIKMGYGRGETSWGQVTGRSGDGGVDGKIREDALGLDKVYVQTKRYGDGNPVRASDVRDFIGALDTGGVTKGVFVTTSSFTNNAKRGAEQSRKQVVLIDGAKLASLMVEYGIGVKTRVTYETKRIDEDYFNQEMP